MPTHPIILNLREQLDFFLKKSRTLFFFDREWNERKFWNIYNNIWMKWQLGKMWRPFPAFSSMSAALFLMKPGALYCLPYDFMDRVSYCLGQERATHSIIFPISLKIICLKVFPTVTFRSVYKSDCYRCLSNHNFGVAT